MKNKKYNLNQLRISLFLVLVPFYFFSCNHPIKPMTATPPIAKIIPETLQIHGHTRIDNYFWLRDRENKEVIDYLNAENAYLDSALAHTVPLQKELFNEMKSRIKEDDQSVPYLMDGYFYYTRFETGKEYPIYCRKKGSLEATEEIMVNVNDLAKDTKYCQLGSLEVSENQELIAYSLDTNGRRIYTTYFKNLKTGQLLTDVITNNTGNLAWANDNKTVFYSRQDEQTLRSHQIYKHILGTNPSQDALIYEEKDETFSAYIGKTKSKAYLVIHASSTLSDESQILNANTPDAPFKVFLKREANHEYSIDHAGEHFYIRSNWNAKNFRLLKTTENQSSNKNEWAEIIPNRDQTLLEGFEVFKDFLVIEERNEGLIKLRIIGNQTDHYVNFGEPSYLATLSTNRDYNSKKLRYIYTSLTTPMTTFDYDMTARTKTLLKQQEVMDSKFKPENYKTERIYATAPDGVKVPISLVYHIGTKLDGTAPLYQYAYGSYGHSIDASFSSIRLSLLDRGFVFAICHIRGGEDMGRQWYEDGKLLKKKNTFTDFIACSEHLISQKYTNAQKLVANGGSAGGLLMGAIVNMRPDLYKAIIADVPFVDVISTMLDETIPLTTGEFDEWGNPKNKTYYDYILSYSPYDNVTPKAYPHILITTGLHDSQVQYWEPAKWVAKLRQTKTDNNRLYLKTNMDAGHGGASGRFKSIEEVALKYAFLFDILDIK